MTKVKLYTEEQVQRALFAVENGQKLREAAREYGIPHSTLNNRFHGTRTIQEAHNDQKLLSPEQEDMLAHWIRVQYTLLNTPSHRQIRLAAQGILREGGSNHEIHDKWTFKFLNRHPYLKGLKGQKLDTDRVKGVEPDKIKDLFK